MFTEWLICQCDQNEQMSYYLSQRGYVLGEAWLSKQWQHLVAWQGDASAKNKPCEYILKSCIWQFSSDKT